MIPVKDISMGVVVHTYYCIKEKKQLVWTCGQACFGFNCEVEKSKVGYFLIPDKRIIDY